MTRFYTAGVLFCFLAGCGNLSERERQLTQKDAELAAREQALHLREEKMKMQENEIRSREEKLNAVATDTTIYRYAGVWSVRMTCIESTCPSSVVGDTKSESWVVSARGNMLLARVLVNRQLVRVYSGALSAQGATLYEEVEASATEGSAKIAVDLVLLEDGSVEGKRTINRDNGCVIVYALQMKKASPETGKKL